MFHNPTRIAQAGLVMLIILQAIMLMSLFAGVRPHPPVQIPIGGIAPILATSFAAAAAALVLGPVDNRVGQGFAGFAVIIAMLSFGPQKYIDAQFGLIWPAVLMAQVAAVMVIGAMFAKTRDESRHRAPAG